MIKYNIKQSTDPRWAEKVNTRQEVKEVIEKKSPGNLSYGNKVKN